MRDYFSGGTLSSKENGDALSDADMASLNRGGHDPLKVYAAFSEAMQTKGQPTVVLVKTVKGYGLSSQAQSVNKTHQIKKLDLEGLKYFRDRFDLPFSDSDLETLPFYRPDENSSEMKYLKGRREALGGHLPNRRSGHIPLEVPDLDMFDKVLDGSGDKEQRQRWCLCDCLCHAQKRVIQDRVVPIVIDEARTFGLEGMFRQWAFIQRWAKLYARRQRSLDGL